MSALLSSSLSAMLSRLLKPHLITHARCEFRTRNARLPRQARCRRRAPCLRSPRRLPCLCSPCRPSRARRALFSPLPLPASRLFNQFPCPRVPVASSPFRSSPRALRALRGHPARDVGAAPRVPAASTAAARLPIQASRAAPAYSSASSSARAPCAPCAPCFKRPMCFPRFSDFRKR